MYGMEALQQLQLWEKCVLRESNFKNHRIFTSKCISYNLLLVSVKLKSSCSKISPGGRKIIEKAERQLLQDRVRGINKTIEESGIYINSSKTRLLFLVTSTTDRDRCSKFFDKVREDRYNRVKARQVRKFHNLVSKSKQTKANNTNNNVSSLSSNAISSDSSINNSSQLQDNINNKWVITLSSISLTEGQKSVLAKGPNYSLTPKFIPNVDYITAMETMCSN